MIPRILTAFWVVFAKELLDALRDRKTLLMVTIGSTFGAPLALVVLSHLLESVEAQTQAQEVMAVGLEHAPTLANFLARQTIEVLPAPSDFRMQLESGALDRAVIVVPGTFEADLAAGRAMVPIIGNSASRNGAASLSRTSQVLQSFNQEQAALGLLVHNIAPDTLQPLHIDCTDLASTGQRAARFTAMLPFFFLLAAIYGALNISHDTTAGERERGSLEVLVQTPASRSALVLGKWASVSTVSFAISTLASVALVPAQAMVHSEALAGAISYRWPQVLSMMAILAPLCALISALFMALSIHARTTKEAAARTSICVMLVSLLPMLSSVQAGGQAPWQGWAPFLAQSSLMSTALHGEAIPWRQLAPAATSAALLTACCLIWVTKVVERSARA